MNLGGNIPYRVNEDAGMIQVLLILSKASSFNETAEVHTDNFAATGM